MFFKQTSVMQMPLEPPTDFLPEKYPNTHALEALLAYIKTCVVTILSFCI